VRELAHARGPLVADALRARGAEVLGADPLLSTDDVTALHMTPWGGAPNAEVTAVVVATADAAYRTMDFAKIFPNLKVLIDGRNACAGAIIPAGAARIGFGRPNGVAAQ